MYDKGKVIPGLVVFVGIVLFPFWRNLAPGGGVEPHPKLPTTEKECVLPREQMRETHMELLNDWRRTVVRTGVRTSVTATGKHVQMSLTGTCLSCHPNKGEFCDTCHNYLAVKVYCFDCHLEKRERS
jgi:hypothetical protein